MYKENITNMKSLIERENARHETRIAEYNEKLAEYEKLQDEYIDEKLATENAYLAFFDGLKFVADAENPIPLTFPMRVKANLFYKDGDKVYVALKDGFVKAINEEYFTEF